MYCAKCGLEILDDAKFCGFCGEPTDGLTSRQTRPTQPTQPTQPTPMPDQGTSATTRRSSNTTGRIIAGVCIVFVIGIFFVFGTQLIPSTGISILIVGAIILCCVVGNTGSRRSSGSGGCNCGGCDCSGCDCGDCDCGGCDC